MRSILKKIFNRMVDDSYTNEEKEIMEYIFILYSFELIKAVIIIGSFSLAGYFKEVLIICSVMFLSKPFIGGYHEETQFKCLIVTMISILSIIILGKNSAFMFYGNVVILALSVFCIWHQAPIIDKKMPLTNTYLIRRNRIRGTVILGMFSILSIVLIEKSSYYIFITWTVVFQALAMFMKNTDKHKGKNRC